MGCFGAPLTGGNVSRYCNNHEYNKQAARTQMIKAAANQNPPVFGFDCVCLIKGILWGDVYKRQDYDYLKCSLSLAGDYHELG